MNELYKKEMLIEELEDMARQLECVHGKRAEDSFGQLTCEEQFSFSVELFKHTEENVTCLSFLVFGFFDRAGARCSFPQDSTYYSLCYTKTHFQILLGIHLMDFGSDRFCGKSVRSWCDRSSDRSFMGWTH